MITTTTPIQTSKVKQQQNPKVKFDLTNATFVDNNDKDNVPDLEDIDSCYDDDHNGNNEDHTYTNNNGTTWVVTTRSGFVVKEP